jgi:hypothetical protein
VSTELFPSNAVVLSTVYTAVNIYICLVLKLEINGTDFETYISIYPLIR